MNKLTMAIATLTAAAAACASGSAAAQDSGKGYVGLSGGLALTSNTEIEDSAGTVTIDYDLGYAGSLAGGYKFNRAWRVEAELAYRQNDVSEFASGGSTVNGTGTVRSFSTMANGYLDFGTGDIMPYVGAGLGVIVLQTSDVSATVNNITLNFDDDITETAAFQGMLGVAYRVSDAMRVKADYRYFYALPVDVSNSDGDFNYQGHNFLVGLNYSF